MQECVNFLSALSLSLALHQQHTIKIKKICPCFLNIYTSRFQRLSGLKGLVMCKEHFEFAFFPNCYNLPPLGKSYQGRIRRGFATGQLV